MVPLKKSQQKVYDYIIKCKHEGIVPSVREICNATGLKSTSTVHLHLKNLEKLGLIERKAGLNRCIQLPSEEGSTQVPVLGRVAAGVPILATQNIDFYVPISDSLRRGRELFGLCVSGDSMVDAGILDGDILIVNSTPTADNGQIVVAMIDDEATVKRFFKENGHYRLQPENGNYSPIIVDDVVVLGVVVSLIRNY